MSKTHIGRYEIRGEIGRGGMATVYRGYDPRFRREVAIKVLQVELLHDPAFTERFQQEAYTVASLEHSAIVPVYDYGEGDNGQPYLVMRYMKGGTLKERLRDVGTYTAEEATHILERIASALDAAHRAGTIHRDVKPPNILFDEYGEAYLADFGLVKMLEVVEDLSDSGVRGTPAYMAPEVANRGALTSAVDTYALTVTLFQMLTGQLPFGSKSPVGQLIANVTEVPPDVTYLRAGLPPAIDFVIRRGLAKNPKQRYETAGTLASDFQAAIHGKPLSFDPAQEPGPDTINLTNIVNRLRLWMAHNRRIAIPFGGVIGLLLIYSLLTVLIEPRATAQSTALTPGPNVTPVSASSTEYIGGGGGYIAYQSNRGGRISLFLLSQATREQLPVALDSSSNVMQPVWSPDGKKLAYTSDQNGNFDIYVIDLEDNGQHQLTNHPASDLSPTWSPDGHQIAFASDRDGMDFDIYVMTLDDLTPLGEPVRLSDNPYNDLEPRWSPRGSLLVYTTYLNGNADIGILTTRGTVRGLLTEDSSDDLSPEWSPDGTKIAFASARDGDWEIYIVHTDGSGLRQFTTNTIYDGEPAWSPNGQWIVYSSGKYLTQHLFIAAVDGSKKEELTAQTTYFFDFPAWQPPAP